MKSTTSKTDYRAVVVSLLVAILFWVMNALNKENYTQKIAFPLRFNYNDSLYIPTQPLPEKVSVNVSGNGWSLLRKALALDITPIYYTVKKPLQTKFLNTSTLTDSLSEHIKDVKVNYVIADRFDLEFERRVHKTITLKVDSLHIPLHEGFVVSSLINLHPTSIEVDGPESAFTELGEFLYIKVPGRRIQENFDEEIKIPLPKNTNLKASKERVQVSFEVSELLK